MLSYTHILKLSVKDYSLVQLLSPNIVDKIYPREGIEDSMNLVYEISCFVHHTFDVFFGTFSFISISTTSIFLYLNVIYQGWFYVQNKDVHIHHYLPA